jgi:hypothetical protein
LAIGALVFFWFSPPLPTDTGDAAPVAQNNPALPATASGAAAGAASSSGSTMNHKNGIGDKSTAAPNPSGPAQDGVDPTRDLSSYVVRGQNPTAAEVIDRLHQAGIHSGLGAFSPPGTRPPLIGLAVPEDFNLPDGYVRHHQATDDGQRIEAILMFAPDRPIFDAAGRAIPVPKDRVVPPEYAPPGLPLRRIVLPKPVDAAGR